MPWQTPKTNWTPADGVSDADFNRIEGNLALVPWSTNADITYYVNNTTGNDNNNGLSSGTAFKTIMKAISMIPQVVMHSVVINVADGTYSESVTMNGYRGAGSIVINGNTSVPTNVTLINFAAFGCACKVTVQGFLGISTTADVFYAYNCSAANFLYDVTTVTSSHAGYFFAYSRGLLMNSIASNKTYAILADYSSVVATANMTGTGNGYGVYCSGASTVGKNGTMPSGSTPEYSICGGKITQNIPNMPNNFTSPGYRYNDDGSLEQWGYVGIYLSGGQASQTTDVSLPIAFPNRFLSVCASCTYGNGGDSWAEAINGVAIAVGKTTVRVKAFGIVGGVPAASYEISWHAIGY